MLGRREYNTSSGSKNKMYGYQKTIKHGIIEPEDEQWENVKIKSRELKGPNSRYVDLISENDRHFIVERKVAMLSPTISAMLSGPIEYKVNHVNSLKFKNISGDTLNCVCNYLQHKALCQLYHTVTPFHVRRDKVLQLLMAAHFLQC